jgi:Zn-dependent protease with chaperone function
MPQEPASIKGQFFAPASSAAREAILLATNGIACIHFPNQEADDIVLAIENVQDRYIQFEKGYSFQASAALPPHHGIMPNMLKRFILWCEAFSWQKTLALMLIFVVCIIGFRAGLKIATRIAVAQTPYAIEKELGQNSYRIFEKTLFKPSKLSLEQQKRLRQKAYAMANKAKLTYKPDILFHQSPSVIGANAFALPGGPIVVTDDLVNLMENDEQILAVIAHEYAHIEQRHSLKQIYDVIGMTAIATLVLGHEEAWLESATGGAVGLWSMRNSRHFEKDADMQGIDMLRANNMSAKPLYEAINLLLRQSDKNNNQELPFSNDSENWLSTHPSGDDRLKYLQEAIDNQA